ncbi:MAG: DUF2927 domain-containing protein [Pseudomonadota bacterium]
MIRRKVAHRTAHGLALLLAACTIGTPAPLEPGSRPTVDGWLAAVPWGTADWDHESLAALFRRLTLGFEDGGERAGLLRLAQPVQVAVSRPGSDDYRSFTADYATFLARETGIDIASAAPGARPSLTISLVPAPENRLPLGARCLHLPGSVSWSDYAQSPARIQATARETTGEVSTATVFIAAGLPPAAIRACLLEEIPQAMGLGNDVPLLGPTIFNDDGAHLWPTSLDLLMLRLLYAPAIFPGTPPDAVEAAALGALKTLAPESPSATGLPLPPLGASLRYRRALADFAQARRSGDERQTAAALTDLRAATPSTEPGAALARCTTGLLTHRVGAERRQAMLAITREDCRTAERASSPGESARTGPRTLRLAILEAEALLAEGRPAEALSVLDASAPDLAALGNDAGLARLHHLRSVALSDMGQDASAARALAAAWARHALGRETSAPAETED